MNTTSRQNHTFSQDNSDLRLARDTGSLLSTARPRNPLCPNGFQPSTLLEPFLRAKMMSDRGEGTQNSSRELKLFVIFVANITKLKIRGGAQRQGRGEGEDQQMHPHLSWLRHATFPLGGGRHRTALSAFPTQGGRCPRRGRMRGRSYGVPEVYKADVVPVGAACGRPRADNIRPYIVVAKSAPLRTPKRGHPELRSLAPPLPTATTTLGRGWVPRGAAPYDSRVGPMPHRAVTFKSA